MTRIYHLKTDSNAYGWGGLCGYDGDWGACPDSYVDLDEVEEVTCKACRDELKSLALRIETVRLEKWIKE